MKRYVFILGLLALISIPAMADDCDYRYGWERDGDWWRPVFTREPCASSLQITYKVYFDDDGSSDQSRMVYIMSSKFSATARGSQRYDRRGRISIIEEKWGEPSGESRSSSSNTRRSGDNTLKETIDEAGGALAIMAVMAIIVGGNDIYTHWVNSQDYGGYNFGLKNTMSRRLDIEVGFEMYKAQEKMQTSSDFFRTDHSYSRKSSDGSFDMNAVYNLLPRRKIVNPYVGIGTTTLYGNGPSSFGMGGIAGASVGAWNDRLQLHVRYKWLKNFDYPEVLTNQIELGLSVKYKRGWGFSDQQFYDPEYYDEEGAHLAIHAGFSTASVSAKIKGNPVSVESRTGYNMMLYLTGNVWESPWTFNWGIIGVSSLGWQMNGIQQNLYYLPMSLGTSYQINLPIEFLPLSILPSAGLQWGFLVDSNDDAGINYDTDLNKFDIGPSLGAALRIDNTLELGMQYDMGLINVFKQKDKSNRTDWKFYNRNLQFFTRMFF
ncbi:MAG: PorT family protein [Bacteroidales bacterium]|nr:PorT family protein [Bacteroidales bacterium]